MQPRAVGNADARLGGDVICGSSTMVIRNWTTGGALFFQHATSGDRRAACSGPQQNTQRRLVSSRWSRGTAQAFFDSEARQLFESLRAYPVASISNRRSRPLTAMEHELTCSSIILCYQVVQIQLCRRWDLPRTHPARFGKGNLRHSRQWCPFARGTTKPTRPPRHRTYCTQSCLCRRIRWTTCPRT